jgi:hypothetical protein
VGENFLLQDLNLYLMGQFFAKKPNLMRMSPCIFQKFQKINFFDNFRFTVGVMALVICGTIGERHEMQGFDLIYL